MRAPLPWRLAFLAIAFTFVCFNLQLSRLSSAGPAVAYPPRAHETRSLSAEPNASIRSAAPPTAAAPTARDTALDGGAACGTTRRPYHVLLTASSGPYQEWQSRIFHYHYLRLKRLNPCSDIGGFTRLLTLPAGMPMDNLSRTMRTVVSTELKKGSEDLGFVVLNRPHSLRDVVRRGALRHIEEEHVLITETDHIFLKPLPNLAASASALDYAATAAFNAVGYPFHYMLPTRNPLTIKIVARHAGAHAAKVQQVGPSPVLLPIRALQVIIDDWLDLSFALKRDPEADAEFNWMLEMWGYSIACAKHGVHHMLPSTLQLEPSSQFGVTISQEPYSRPVYGRLPMEEATHNILHYTFSHEYSYEGVAMIDTIHGEWRFDKRAYQQVLPRSLPPPPACALESAWVLWRSLHEAMAAADSWPEGAAAPRHAPLVADRVRGLRGGGEATELALRLVGSGPWRWGSDRPLFFMRGGFLVTPWGTARWGASEDGARLVIFMCGVEFWSHSATLTSVREDGTGATLELMSAPPKTPVGGGVSAEEATANRERTHAQLEQGFVLPSQLAADERADALAALAADAQPGGGKQGGGLETVAEVRRRLMGTGPWPIRGVGDVYFLARGVVYVGSGGDGRWHVQPSRAGEPPTVVVSIGRLVSVELMLSCWRLTASGSPQRYADFVWPHAAKQCFSTCSDSTHPITSSELNSEKGALARRVMKAAWSWGLNREGLRFAMDQGEGVLITPWGHGTWALVPSRSDVLLAEFAQQRHMLRFFAAEPKYVSTRCNDGDLLAGTALRPSEVSGTLHDGWWNAP